MNVTKDEILAKCTVEDLASGNYHDIAAKVNVGRTKTELVQIADVQAHLQSTGVWWAIKEVALTTGHPAKAAAEAVLDVASARYNNVDLSLPLVGYMLSALKDASVLTQDQFDHLVAMGVSPDPVTWEQCFSAMNDEV